MAGKPLYFLNSIDGAMVEGAEPLNRVGLG